MKELNNEVLLNDTGEESGGLDDDLEEEEDEENLNAWSIEEDLEE